LIFYPDQARLYQQGLVYQENIGTHQEVKKAHRSPWGAMGLLAGAGDGHYGANAKVYVSKWVHVLRNRGHLSSTLGRKPLGLQWLRRGFFFPKPFSSMEKSTHDCKRNTIDNSCSSGISLLKGLPALAPIVLGRKDESALPWLPIGAKDRQHLFEKGGEPQHYHIPAGRMSW